MNTYSLLERQIIHTGADLLFEMRQFELDGNVINGQKHAVAEARYLGFCKALELLLNEEYTEALLLEAEMEAKKLADREEVEA